MICEKCLKEKDNVKRRTFFPVNRTIEREDGSKDILPRFIKTKNDWCDECAEGFAKLQGNRFNKVQ